MLRPHFQISLLVFGFALSGASLAGEVLPVVTLTVGNDSAAEAGQDTAGFTVTRSSNGNKVRSAGVLRESVVHRCAQSCISGIGRPGKCLNNTPFNNAISDF